MKRALREVKRAPMFSVLVPSYNHATYLRPALDSLIAQSASDWEAVVVDDGSTDESLAIAQAAAARDSRIRVVSQTNGGVAAALNTAAAHARGSWFCWLSADDLFAPTALATFAHAISAHPGARFFHANFHLLDEVSQTRRSYATRPDCLAPRGEQIMGLFHHNYVNGITVCFQRSLFTEVGPFDLGYPAAQDLEYWLRVAEHTDLHYLDSVVAVTRVHAGQETMRLPDGGRFDAARACLTFLEAHDLPALFPTLDLTQMHGLMAALSVTLRTALHLNAEIYAGTGPTPYLLDRFRAWMHDAHTPAVCQAVAEGLQKVIVAETAGPLRSVLERFAHPTPEPVTIPDPYELMVAEHRRLMETGAADAATRLGRYLSCRRPDLAAASGITTPSLLAAMSDESRDTSPTNTSPTLEIRRLAPEREIQRIVSTAAQADAAAALAAVARAGERFPGSALFEALASHNDDAALLAAANALSSGTWHLTRIPRIAHFYWGGERTSYLRYLSVASFQRVNPDWEVRVYVPATVTSSANATSWTTRECYEGDHFFGRDYTRDLFALPGVQCCDVSFDAWPAIANARETFKADLFRWHILSGVGGLYSDADIVYHRPMSAASFNTAANRDAEIGYCRHYGVHFIGFLLGAPGAAVFGTVASIAPRAFDARNYQSIGSHLVNDLYPTDAAMAARHGDIGHFNVPMDVVYAYDWRVIDQMHAPGDLATLPADAIGIHWYGGASSSQQYNALVTHENCGRFGSVLDQLVARVTRTLTTAPGAQLPPTVRRAQPRFSILVPTCNQATLLTTALDSLMAQTFMDFEVIVVNDGSADDTRAVLNTYAATHPQVRAIHQESGGVAVALNTALSHATGDWICSLSSDGRLEPTALATFVESQQAYPSVRFFHANFSLLHEPGGRLEAMADCRNISSLPAADIQTLSLLRANHVNGSTICIDRALMESAGGWNPSYCYAQDYDLWLRLSLRARFQFIDRRVALTRMHDGPDTHRFPMGGGWDAARAAHSLISGRSFVELCPWADLANDASVLRVIRTAVTVLADSASFIYQGAGPNALLLDRMAQWLTVPDAAGRNRTLGTSLYDAIQKLPEISPVLRTAAERLKGPPLGVVASTDPVALMRQRLRASPDAPWADEMHRYLTALACDGAPAELDPAILALERAS